jgi:predicted glycoside hydrolase/deacetylase ChbG (UPF0249 family)
MTDFLKKNNQISNSTKIRPVLAELSHAEVKTDMTMQIDAFLNFMNVLKKHFTVHVSFSLLSLYCCL